MKNIVVFGAGKAGLIHLKAYKKLNLEDKLYFVDVNQNTNYIKEKTIYKDIQSLLKEHPLNPQDTILDIAVPKDVFYDVINECKDLGFKDYIIEKPFILKDNNDFSDLNMVMVENYLYSRIFSDLKKYIQENNKKVKTVFSNFSKNRRSNSLSGRGMASKVVNCFNIEMPHQVYMSQDLVEGLPNVIFKQARDMEFEDFSLKDHGEGLLVIENNGAVSYLYSNLTTDILTKNIAVTTVDNYVIKGEFFTYTPDLKVISKGSLQVYKDGELIQEQLYEEDDMITYMMEEFINYFNSNAYNPLYRQRIIAFSNFYNKYDI